MLTLRYYQEEAVTSIFNYFAEKTGNPIVALPTGTGKALVIAEFMRRALHCYPQTRIMCLTHVKELVAQNHAELVEQWPQAPAGIFSAGLDRKETHLPITFCGIASVHKCLSFFGRIDLVIIDECHMISDKSATMYAKAIGELRTVNPALKVVGFTATPFRSGMGLLTEGKLFTDICIDYTGLDKFNELVAQGYIAPLVPRRTDTELDVTGVGITNGEYNIDELQAAVDKQSITIAALTEAYELANNRKHWLVFCTGTAHADHARDILISMGVSAVCVHSNLAGGDGERDYNIQLFKSGQVQAMVGVGVFTTGFNFKPIDCIVVLRPTMSTVLWVQLLGRGTRPCPETGKMDCLVLDFAANTRRLGCINDPVLPKKKGKKSLASVPYKTCPQCQTYCHIRVRFCPVCQHEFPEHFAAAVNAATDELIRKEKKPAEPKPVVIPIFTEHIVTRVEYAKHWSKHQATPPSLRATYYCGSRTFNEWLCFEHTGHFPRHKAHDAWRMMGGETPPATVDEALEQVEHLQPPTKIRVLEKDKWPEVVGYEFGSPGAALPLPYAVDDAGETVRQADDSGHYNAMHTPLSDDDIPF